MSARPFLVKWEISPGLAPWSMTAVVAGDCQRAAILRISFWR